MSALNVDGWSDLARGLMFRDNAFIDGEFIPARSGRRFAAVNPATNEVLAEVAACGQEDIDAAVLAARKSFETGSWSGCEPERRKDVLFRLSELILQNLEELSLLDSLSMGKLVRDASSIDVPASSAIFRWYAEAIDKLYGEVAPAPHGNLVTVQREPLGVVGAVVPWNFPLEMATWKLAPALAAGNSVVLKPAEQATLSALRLAELAMEAGLPPGVLNVVPGFGATAGQALGRHMDVDCLVFTGSTAVGKMFLQYSGQSNMKQVWPETGGKSPNIIFADCDDLDTAARMAAQAIFANQGQVCSANSRLLVQRHIKDRFLEKLIGSACAYKPGNPLDPTSTMGALVDARHTKNVMRFIDDGRKTAKLICGGEQVRIGGSDNYVLPTIFDSVSPEDPLAREEIFGPVLAIMSFDTDDQAIALANDSPYGLAASIWTSNLSRAHGVSRRLSVGTVSVNTVDALSPMTPFGGVKQSGFGRDLSLHALDKFTALKTTWIKY